MKTFKANVFKTPWGPCVRADHLVQNLGIPLGSLIQHVGCKFHVGLFEGACSGFIEVGGLHRIPGLDGVPGTEV